MGTVAAMQTHAPERAAWTPAQACVRAAFDRVEERLNAHEAGSEISRLAARPEAEALAACDSAMRPCYAAAFALAQASGGAFSPRWRGPNTLDLGAIAKGFAVDLAWEAVRAQACEAECLIDLGGNLRAYGGSWRTGVLDPSGEGYASVVDLQDGEALATSATYYRGGHIVDGRTGAVVSNGVASVTVLCRSALWADALSTTLFVLGPGEGKALLDGKRLPAEAPADVSVLWILNNGNHVTYGSHARFQGN